MFLLLLLYSFINPLAVILALGQRQYSGSKTQGSQCPCAEESASALQCQLLS